MISLVLVDDHALFRLGVRLSLEQHIDIDIWGEAANGADFFDKLNSLPTLPQIALIDIVLPDMSGIEIAQQMRTKYPDVKILMLSAEVNESVIMQLMKIGIDGFVSKSEPVETLYTAIIDVADGIGYYGKEISRLICDIQNAKQIHAELSDREQEIISMCTQGYTSKQIADRLNVSNRTITTHKDNIFKKLGISNSVELVKFALEKGFIKI